MERKQKEICDQQAAAEAERKRLELLHKKMQEVRFEHRLLFRFTVPSSRRKSVEGRKRSSEDKSLSASVVLRRKSVYDRRLPARPAKKRRRGRERKLIGSASRRKLLPRLLARLKRIE